MSRWQPGAAEIERALAEGTVEEVQASQEVAHGLVASARRHLVSAGAVVEGDPEGAYALANDAARKAATALLALVQATVVKGGEELAVGAAVAGSEGLLVALAQSFPLWLSIAGAAAGALAAAISGPIMVVALGLLYYDTRVRQEGLDLQLMMQSLDMSASSADGRAAPAVLPG